MKDFSEMTYLLSSEMSDLNSVNGTAMSLNVV